MDPAHAPPEPAHGQPDWPATLERLEHAAGSPIPSGSLRLWSAELYGGALRVERASQRFFEDLARLRDDIERNDELRVHRAQQLQREAAQIEQDLGALVRRADRLAHSREPESPIELLAANELRHDILTWISDARALECEHEEWLASSLQVDIGGPG